MAHFAKLDENNVVLSVHSVGDEHLMKNGIENEEVGINFLRNVHGWEHWKQTSSVQGLHRIFSTSLEYHQVHTL